MADEAGGSQCEGGNGRGVELGGAGGDLRNDRAEIRYGGSNCQGKGAGPTRSGWGPFCQLHP